jgi:hypothetical protein
LVWVPDESVGPADRSPVAAAFELQGRTLEGSQQASERSVERLERLNEAMVAGVDSEADASTGLS